HVHAPLCHRGARTTDPRAMDSETLDAGIDDRAGRVRDYTIAWSARGNPAWPERLATPQIIDPRNLTGPAPIGAWRVCWRFGYGQRQFTEMRLVAFLRHQTGRDLDVI